MPRPAGETGRYAKKMSANYQKWKRMRKVIGIMAIMFFACSIVYASDQNKSSVVTKMNNHEKINYVEFPSKNLAVTKAFFIEAFGWSFVDYGPEYIAFKNEGLDGSFL